MIPRVDVHYVETARIVGRFVGGALAYTVTPLTTVRVSVPNPVACPRRATP